VTFREIVGQCLPARLAEISELSIDPYRITLDPAHWTKSHVFDDSSGASTRHIEEMRAQAQQFISAPCTWAV
jgi:hypothetical protein